MSTEDVAIVAAAQTKFGEHWEESLRSLSTEAIYSLFNSVEKGFSANNIDGIIVSNVGSDLLNGQLNLGVLVADYGGLGGKPAFRIEASGASGGIALTQAVMNIKSGLWNSCLVVGVEKMTDQTRSSAIVTLQSSALDAEWEALPALTESSAFAMVAQAYFNKYPDEKNRQYLSAVPAKNHANAVYNARAHFRRAFKIDQISRASPVAEPLTLLDCSPASDGAAAVLLTKASIAKNFTDTPVYIKGFGIGTDTIALHDRQDLFTFHANRVAAEQAFKMVNLSVKDVKVAEIYDNYSITELITLEDLGFFEPGTAGKATFEGQTALSGGKVAVNPSGGLKAMGHPIGATGVAQAAEIFWQLRQEVNQERQTNAEVGLSHSLGGSGSVVAVNIFTR